MPRHLIRSLDLPGLEPYRTLRRPLEHIEQGIFVAEGEKVVRRLLGSSLAVLSLLLTPEWFDQYERSVPIPRDADIYVGEKELLETIVGFNLHQGIMAVARVPADTTLEEIIALRPGPKLLAAIDGLANAENVGVVTRNCAAFGADALLAGETSSSPYLRRAVRNSMGTVFTLPVLHTRHLAGVLLELREAHGFTVVGAALDPGAVPLARTPLAGDVCVVFGNEGSGISQEVAAACSVKSIIPMLNGTDSLNVASASAVVLYEAQRQRAHGGSSGAR